MSLIRLNGLADLADQSAITLDLGGGVRLVSTRHSVTSHAPGEYTWAGGLLDNLADVTLSGHGGNVAGAIRTVAFTYAIHPLGDGLHALIRVDASQFPTCFTGSSGEATEEAAGAQGNAVRSLDASSAGGASSVAAVSVIDMLVVYTGLAAQQAGDITAFINKAIRETNKGLKGSGVSDSLRLAHKAQVTYTSRTGYLQDDVDWVSTSYTVSTLRNQYGADVVVLIVDDVGDDCGRAKRIEAGATEAFAVVRVDCESSGQLTFAHEVGHLIGGRHEKGAVACLDKDPASTHGYPYSTGGWRTIMSCDTRLTRINRWSDPYRTHNGIPTGVAGVNEVAAKWRSRAAAVAAFKTPPPPPAPPQDLVITNAGSIGQRPMLDWDNNTESDLDHYNVYRCTYTYSCTWQLIGSPTNSSFTDTYLTMTGMYQGDEYGYHVTAVNTSGAESGRSNTVTTWAEPFARMAAAAVPEAFALHQSAPNPFSSSTEIRYDLPEAALVQIVVYNLLGQEVRRLVDGEVGAGFHAVTFDAGGLPSGVYLYRLTAGAFTQTRRMVLTR